MNSNITHLLLLLYQGEKLTTSEIAKTYNVSLRTAQRYIKIIKNSGFNVKKINKKYFLEINISNEEKIILQTLKLFLKTKLLSLKNSLKKNKKLFFYFFSLPFHLFEAITSSAPEAVQDSVTALRSWAQAICWIIWLQKQIKNKK